MWKRGVIAIAAMWMGRDGGSDGAGMSGTATSGLTTTGLPPGTGDSSGGGPGSESTSEVDPGTSSSTSAATTRSTSSSTGSGPSSSSTGESSSSTGEPIDPPDPLWVSPNLWYSTENRLNYIEIDPANGSVVQLVTGPETIGGTAAGLSGITGPLTECVTTLPPPGVKHLCGPANPSLARRSP